MCGLCCDSACPHTVRHAPTPGSHDGYDKVWATCTNPCHEWHGSELPWFSDHTAFYLAFCAGHQFALGHPSFASDDNDDCSMGRVDRSAHSCPSLFVRRASRRWLFRGVWAEPMQKLSTRLAVI